ncbi:MAG: 30S ribosomal protein S4 [Planctomycetia bacterium]|nr:30S ribosomal protein S4 [Planctomycetia bacterium]
MARTLGAVCKRCRREGVKLFLKGSRCDSALCALTRRPIAPGMHGFKRGKMTDYGVHLREKQKVKTYYGVLEKQFRKYYQMAERSKGNTGKELMSLLERRLDNIVFRMGFATSRAAARQTISHGHILVNGKFVNVPSFLVRPGDVISVKNRKGSIELVKTAIASVQQDLPDFLSTNDTEIPSGVVMRLPLSEDVSLPVQPQLIVELCSK